MQLASRYEVTELLGDGTFGRVVLARDRLEDRHVAVKIIRDVKRYRENARIEADILKDIQRADPEGKRKCSIMYSVFTHESRFFCLVATGEWGRGGQFDPRRRPSLYTSLKQNAYRGFWLQDLQSFASQSLGALAFLHDKLRLTHTDLKPENILLESTAPARPSSFPRDAAWLETHRGPVPDTPYLRPVDARIKLIDFGNATYEHQHHSSTINTRQYRSPEVVLESGWDEISDVWSLGCIVMELYTGSLLFQTHENLEHLALMERVLGPFPARVLEAAGKRAKKSYLVEQDSAWRLKWPQGAVSTVSECHVHDQQPLQILALRQHHALVALVEWMLTIDRRERPSAVEALRHPFFSASFDD